MSVITLRLNDPSAGNLQAEPWEYPPVPLQLGKKMMNISFRSQMVLNQIQVEVEKKKNDQRKEYHVKVLDPKISIREIEGLKGYEIDRTTWSSTSFVLYKIDESEESNNEN